MHSWEVVCVDGDGELEHPRDVETIGILVANNVRRRNVDTANVQLANDQVGYYVQTEGGDIALEPASDDGKKFVTAGADADNDPLLSLPTFEAYETQERFADA